MKPPTHQRSSTPSESICAKASCARRNCMQQQQLPAMASVSRAPAKLKKVERIRAVGKLGNSPFALSAPARLLYSAPRIVICAFSRGKFVAGRGAILWWFCALTALLSLEFTPNLPAQETVRSPAGQVTARLTELPPATLSKQTPSRPEVLPNPAPGPVMPPPIAPATEPRIAATPEQAPPRVFRIAPRYGNKFQIDTDPEQKAILISGGVLLNIRGTEQSELLDIEADNAVIWTKDDAQQFFQNVQTAQGQTSRDSEFFLSGNVVILTHVGNEDRKIRCEKAYYDTKRSVAVAIGADVEFRDKAFTEALHFRAGEVYQLNANDFKAVRVEIFSSRLPSDPGLKIVFAEATMSQKHTTRTSVLGLPFVNEQTGQVEETTQRIFQGYNGLVELRDVPILYVPYMQGDAANTQGPIKDFAVRRSEE